MGEDARQVAEHLDADGASGPPCVGQSGPGTGRRAPSGIWPRPRPSGRRGRGTPARRRSPPGRWWRGGGAAPPPGGGGSARSRAERDRSRRPRPPAERPSRPAAKDRSSMQAASPSRAASSSPWKRSNSSTSSGCSSPAPAPCPFEDPVLHPFQGAVQGLRNHDAAPPLTRPAAPVAVLKSHCRSRPEGMPQKRSCPPRSESWACICSKRWAAV